MAMGGVRLRQRLLPGWEGAPARLTEAILGRSAADRPAPAAGRLRHPRAGRPDPSRPAARPGPLVRRAVALSRLIRRKSATTEAIGAAAGARRSPFPRRFWRSRAAAFVAAHWATGLQDVWAHGMLTFDTLWYHGPFAARIADTGSVWGMHFTDPLYLNWFYPENSELLHGAGIVLFNRDLFSPFVNFGWLGVALLAAWCIGRPYGVAPLSLTAVAIAMDTGPMVPREAGTPATDTVPVAMLLAAAAILITAWAAADRDHKGRPGGGREAAPADTRSAAVPMGAILIAGLAIGIALGSKLTIWGVAVAFAVGVTVPRPAAISAGGRSGSSWREWRRSPDSGSSGTSSTRAIRCPGSGTSGRSTCRARTAASRAATDFTVAHYLFSNPSTGVWRQYFLNPIENLLGPLWFLILGGASAGAILVDLAAALAGRTPRRRGDDRRRDRLRLHAAHRRRPGGPPARLRHQPALPDPGLRARPRPAAAGAAHHARALPAAAARRRADRALLHLPLLGRERRLGRPLRLDPLGGADRDRADRRAGGPRAAGETRRPGRRCGGRRPRDRDRGGRLGASRTTTSRTATTAPRTSASSSTRRFSGRSRRPDLRIGVAGTSGAYNQYGFYGDDVDNYVQYVGRHLPEADFQRDRDLLSLPPGRE